MDGGRGLPGEAAPRAEHHRLLGQLSVVVVSDEADLAVDVALEDAFADGLDVAAWAIPPPPPISTPEIANAASPRFSRCDI